MDARQQDEEGNRQDGEGGQQRQPVRLPRDDDTNEDERRNEQQRADDNGRHGPEHHGVGARRQRGCRVEDLGVAGPRTVRGHPIAVDRGEGPWVVGVDARVRITAGGLEHLVHQARVDDRSLRPRPDDREAEGEAQDDRYEKTGESGRQDPDRMTRPPLPGSRLGAEPAQRGPGADGVAGRVLRRL